MDPQGQRILNILSRVPLGASEAPDLSVSTSIAQNSDWARIARSDPDQLRDAKQFEQRIEFLVYCRDVLKIDKQGEICDALRRGSIPATKIIGWMAVDSLNPNELQVVKVAYSDLQEQVEQSLARLQRQQQNIVNRTSSLLKEARRLQRELPDPDKET